MALFKVDIEKTYGPEFWTNVYYVDAADLATAVTHMGDLLGAEQRVHSAEVTVEKGRVTPVPNPGNAFVTTEFHESGAYTNSAPLMPLFNTVRVDMNVDAGRPSRKFLRGILHTDAIDADGSITGTYQGMIEDQYITTLEGFSWLVDESGNPIVGFTLLGKPSDRQLRRGSKRRTTPILP